VIGKAGSDVQFAASSAESFRTRIEYPWAMALHAPSSSMMKAATAINSPVDADGGRLYVSFGRELHAFDLSEGLRRQFSFSPKCRSINGIALTEDGARLFVVTIDGVHVLDTRTGDIAQLIVSGESVFRAGPVTSDPRTTGRFAYATGCLLDEATGSLVVCDHDSHRIARLRGVC
jgi:hypothetical protein